MEENIVRFIVLQPFNNMYSDTETEDSGGFF